MLELEPRLAPRTPRAGRAAGFTFDVSIAVTSSTRQLAGSSASAPACIARSRWMSAAHGASIAVSSTTVGAPQISCSGGSSGERRA